MYVGHLKFTIPCIQNKWLTELTMKRRSCLIWFSTWVPVALDYNEIIIAFILSESETYSVTKLIFKMIFLLFVVV